MTKPFAPLLVHERGSIAAALAARRADLGHTCETFDGRVGWADRYATKLEHPTRPQGRQGIHFDWPSEIVPGGNVRCSGMGELWLKALGLRLALIDEATADAIGAVDAPPLRADPAPSSKSHARRRARSQKFGATSMGQVESLDRVHVAALAVQSTIADHPFIAERPGLLGKAQSISEALRDLYDLIREAE